MSGASASGPNEAREPTYLELLTDGVRAVAAIVRANQAGAPEGDGHGAASGWDRFEAKARAEPAPTPLGEVARRFQLGSFELQCLLLALVRHVEPDQADGFDPAHVTVGSAVRMLVVEPAAREAASDALGPHGKLIRHGLLMLTDVGPLGRVGSPIALTTPALRYLLREGDLSPSVARFGRLVRSRASLLNVIADERQLEAVRELVEHHTRYRAMVDAWGLEELIPYGRGLTLLVSGPSGTGKTLLAHALGNLSGRPLIEVSAADLPEGQGLEAALADLFVEATVRDALVLLDECETMLGKSDPRRVAVIRAMKEFEGVTILATSQPEQLAPSVDRVVSFEVRLELPTSRARRHIWDLHLPPRMPVHGDVELDSLAEMYDFTGADIKNAVLVAVHRALAEPGPEPVVKMKHLVEGCQAQLGSALEDLTVRARSPLRLRDVVLPDEAKRKVEEIIAAIRNQVRVLNQWGFADRLVTGKGIAALFDGPPGTGKTLCAEVIASELDRPIHRINIPEIVSKWVGETEKHIRDIFQLARVSQAMLLFDEADSLFGARSTETRSATDRYANMEVNLLLQEVERFPGVCFLTTNFFGALDTALLRRIQFRVTFEEPNGAERARAWATLCPKRAPLAEDVDFDELGDRYELNGGRIKNALLRAAYRAAELDSPLTQTLLHESCLDEYAAAGKVTRAQPAPGRRHASE